MSLSTLSIKRPVLTIVLNLAIILFGFIGYKFLGVREYPSIDPAQISIRTNYTGANADIIESQITEPLEKAINSIDGIRNITSSSNQGSSRITIEFNLEKDLEEAANDVRDKVSQAIRSLPEDIDSQPIVSKADADSEAIISMTIQSETRNALELSDYAENVIGQRMETIPGVSGIQIWGDKKYAMRLWINPYKLASYGLTVSDVRDALNDQNVELPSKKITGKNTAANVIEMEITAKKISFEPFMAASIGDIPSSTFLKIFSVTTIPSSTTNPVARTIANNVRTFMENPNIHIIKNVAIRETGISINGLNAIAQFRKNR